MYSNNFTENNKKLCLSLYYEGAISYVFVNGREIHKFKAKDSEILVTPLCLGNIQKTGRWMIIWNKIGINGYLYDFGVDSDAIVVAGIWHIHKYLMKKIR